MHNIIIDKQFKFLLPELDAETYRLLEESILEHGCRDPLVLWKNSGEHRNGENDDGILIDGYNRYKICTEHNIPFRTIEMEFDSRELVIIYIINNQVSRRNLTPIQLSHYRGLHYKADKKVHGDSKRFTQKNAGAENLPMDTRRTASRLAEHYSVSHDTIKRDAKLAETINSIGEISPEAKRKILHGEIPVSRTKLEALSSASKEEIEVVAAQIDEGTYIRRAPRNPILFDSLLPEIRELNTVIKDFASNFNSMVVKLSDGDSAELKPVLRSYIDQLEDLYKSI